MALPKGKNPNIAYVKSLMTRIEKGVKAIEKAEIPREISEQERLIQPVLNELQMAAPRVWNDVSKASIERRREILEGK